MRVELSRKGCETVSRILLKNMKVIDPASRRDGAVADILLEDGAIRAVGQRIDAKDAETIDGEGRLCAAPGLVDMHVHLRGPGFPDKEDILSGCRAAAAGGVTRLLCMPNTKPAAFSNHPASFSCHSPRYSCSLFRLKLSRYQRILSSL